MVVAFCPEHGKTLYFSSAACRIRLPNVAILNNGSVLWFGQCQSGISCSLFFQIKFNPICNQSRRLGFRSLSIKIEFGFIADNRQQFFIIVFTQTNAAQQQNADPQPHTLEVDRKPLAWRRRFAPAAQNSAKAGHLQFGSGIHWI